MVATSEQLSVRAGRGGALDLLRFLASLFVVVQHYGDSAPVPLVRLSPIFDRGYAATDLFLILSGFVLGGVYGPKAAAGRLDGASFLARRLLRIWPAHLIVLAMMGVAFIAAPHFGIYLHSWRSFTWPEFFQQAALLQAWDLGGGGWNLPTWTLSALVVCYAAFPAAWRGLCRLNLPPAACLILGAAAIVIAQLAAVHLFGVTMHSVPLQFGALRALPLFFSGLCLAQAAGRVRWSQATRRWAIGAATAAFALTQFVSPTPVPMILSLGALVFAAGAKSTEPAPGRRWIVFWPSSPSRST